MDHLKEGEVYQDKDKNKPYIDIKGYLSGDMSAKSSDLTKITPQRKVTNDDFKDPNKREINLENYEDTSDNHTVIDLDPTVLTQNTPLYIYGLSSQKGGTNIIINVDTKGESPYDVNSPIKLTYTDGKGNDIKDRPNQETEYFDDNHILWNFYDSTASASDKLYNGEININSAFQGSLLAPRATVDVHQNLDGNIVANRVIVNAETHRWDLQDDSKIETDFDHVVTLPWELDKGEEENPNIDHPDEEEDNDIDPDTDGLVDPDDNESEEDKDTDDGNEGEETGNTTDPEEPSTGEEDKDTDDNDGEETGTTTDPEKPSTEKPSTEKPSTETPGTDDKDDNGNEEGSSTDENTDGDGDLITNGGSEGTDPGTSGDLNNGLLPNVVGKNSDDSQTPSTTSNSGLLPQTGATTGILATIGGLILLAFGLVLKATHIKKEN